MCKWPAIEAGGADRPRPPERSSRSPRPSQRPAGARRVNYFPQENNLMGFRFTLCADDFALSPAVSRGIFEALEARRVSATSVMANRPHWRWAARELNQFAKVAEIGLHLNLTLGAPLSPMPKLAPGNEFPKLQRHARRASLQRKLPETELRGEIARQLDAFEEALGKPPDFVDGHQHIQVLPVIRDSLLAELTARKLAGRTWLRDSSDALSRIVARRIEIGKARRRSPGSVAALPAPRRGWICDQRRLRRLFLVRAPPRLRGRFRPLSRRAGRVAFGDVPSWPGRRGAGRVRSRHDDAGARTRLSPVPALRRHSGGRRRDARITSRA